MLNDIASKEYLSTPQTFRYTPAQDFYLRRKALKLFGNTSSARKWLAAARYLDSRGMWSVRASVVRKAA